MKQRNNICNKFYGLLIFFFICLLLNSCSTYNFSAAQPVDKENLYQFPDEFLGAWLGEEEGSTESYLVNKKNVLLIMNHETKIVKGAWPRQNIKGDNVDLPPSYKIFESIKYDSLRKRSDTMGNYLLRKNRIYEINGEGFLSKGYSYKTDNDTLIVFKYDTIYIDLGYNAFLRRLNKNFYVLNIRNRIFGGEVAEVNDWWMVVLLEITDNKTVNTWDLTNRSGKLPCMFYERPAKSDIFYFDCQWTGAEMLQLIKQGYFEVTSNLYRKKSQ